MQLLSRPAKLDDRETRLLLLNVGNEVLNGLYLSDFQQIIGVSPEEFRKMDTELLAAKGVALPFPFLREYRNALNYVMLELGEDEFLTRLGFFLEEGKNQLEVMNKALAEPQAKGDHAD